MVLYLQKNRFQMKKLILILLMVTFVFSCKTEPEFPPLPPGQYEVTILAEGVYNGLRAYLSSKNEKNPYLPSRLRLKSLIYT